MDAKELENERALRGEILLGDNYSAAEIAEWFDDEREGYFNLYHSESPVAEADRTTYEYAQLAEQHGFRWLPNTPFPDALGIGSAHGAELQPMLERSERVTVLEPSDGFATTTINGKPVTYVKPAASGIMPFADASFDIEMCFAVLHHIPNVSTVLGEMFRVLKPGGYALVREPTHSMGDWRQPRTGLTKRERGIPLPVFRQILQQVGFQVVKETRCMFSLTSRLSLFNGGKTVWTSPTVVKLDRLLCALPIWPRGYGAEKFWHKIRPTCVAYVLRKPIA